MSRELAARAFGVSADSSVNATLAAAVTTIVNKIKGGAGTSSGATQHGGGSAVFMPADFFGAPLERAYESGAVGGDNGGFATTVSDTLAAPGVPQMLVGGGGGKAKPATKKVVVPKAIATRLAGTTGWRKTLLDALAYVNTALQGNLTCTHVKRVLKSAKLI